MRMNAVVRSSPRFCAGAGFEDRAVAICIEKFVPNSGVERFDERILPRLSRLNKKQLGPVFVGPTVDALATA